MIKFDGLKAKSKIGPNTRPEKNIKPSKKGLHLRKSAGLLWSDETLDDWPSNDFRLFAGDLGNEVTDELLASHFRKYQSFNKAKVIRDKRTGKSKGYGFLSFGDPEDMMRALRDMQGKYVGNRPIKLKKSTWKDREIGSGKSLSLGDLKHAVPTKLKSNRKFKRMRKGEPFSKYVSYGDEVSMTSASPAAIAAANNAVVQQMNMMQAYQMQMYQVHYPQNPTIDLTGPPNAGQPLAGPVYPMMGGDEGLEGVPVDRSIDGVTMEAMAMDGVPMGEVDGMVEHVDTTN